MSEITVEIVTKPRRKVIVKRGIRAEEYFTYCEEVGCDIWEQLLSMVSEGQEPVCLWLPEALVAPGTSIYVQGVEKPSNFTGPIPEGFDVLTLPESQYLLFRGEPFEEAAFSQAIGAVWDYMDGFDPAAMGLAWDDNSPRIQLEPRCERGYVELRAVRKMR